MSATEITFVNLTDQEVILFWINFANEEIQKRVLSKGLTHKLDTYIDNKWVVRMKTSDKQLLRITAEKDQTYFILDQDDGAEAEEEFKNPQLSKEISIIQCELCFQKVSFSNYQKHVEDICPEFYQKCTICGDTKIKRKDMIQHDQICEQNAKRCNLCKVVISNAEWDDHQLAHQFSEEAVNIDELPEKIEAAKPEDVIGDVSNECSICMEDMDENDQMFLQCFHKFHNKCIEDWKKKNKLCPICNFEIEE